MNNRLRTDKMDLSTFNNNWSWFFGWGIALIALGLFAISASTLTTLISVILIGVILLIGGIVIIIDTFTFWWRKWQGFFLHLLMGILYFCAGIVLIESPVMGSISITFLLGVFYLLVGLSRVIYALSARMPQWGWNLLSGAIALLLGILILANWPASSLIIIGLFVGIDLLICGWTYVVIALSGRVLTKRG